MAALRGVAVPVFGVVPPKGRVLPLVGHFRVRATPAPHLSGTPPLRVPSSLPCVPPLRSKIGVWSCYAPPRLLIGYRLPMPQQRARYNHNPRDIAGHACVLGLCPAGLRDAPSFCSTCSVGLLGVQNNPHYDCGLCLNIHIYHNVYVLFCTGVHWAPWGYLSWSKVTLCAVAGEAHLPRAPYLFSLVVSLLICMRLPPPSRPP